jgi:hypothetical protein
MLQGESSLVQVVLAERREVTVTIINHMVFIMEVTII